jgi:hypothetical protein
MDRTDLQRLSKDELIELVIQLQRPDKTSRTSSKKLIRRLRELQQQDLTRDELLLKLGAAKKEAGKAYTLLVIHSPLLRTRSFPLVVCNQH